MSAIAVYCGSSPGARPEYLEAATRMGRRIAERGDCLIYGGGDVGLMGAVADGALEAGGEVIGVITEYLVGKEVSHTGLTELLVVESMHERKKVMADRADRFVALPGGVGTLEEIAEVFVWSQLGLQRKPCGFLNVEGFYDSLHEFFGTMTREHFLRPEHFEAMIMSPEVDNLLDRLADKNMVYHPKWQDGGGPS